MEIKILYYYILLNFSLEATEKTEFPIKLSKSLTTFYPEKGIWLELKPRNNKPD
jgi:cytochrome P450 family 9